MASSTGKIIQVTTFGESHGPAVGVVLEGCPPGLEISAAEIQRDLDRRRPGRSALSSQRAEPDQVEILSGCFEGRTSGTPIAMVVRNRDARSRDYEELRDLYRPSHADYTYARKYGVRDWRGGGRAGARETIGRVAAGALARKWLARAGGVEVLAWVQQVENISAAVDADGVTREGVEAHPMGCPDADARERMVARIEEVRKQGDTLGGVIECVARGVPPGLGEPVFDKLHADLARALLSIPAARGFEVGRGFEAAAMRGSEHNDPFVLEDGRVRAPKNDSGGIQGGISNGEMIRLRVAFKPVATIFREQRTVDTAGRERSFTPRGRHDPCVLPRALPIVEAMVLLVLWDHWLRQLALRGEAPSQD